jgi:hypothetical protein
MIISQSVNEKAPSNKLLQLTFDPLRPFASAKGLIVSNDPELGHSGSGLFL